MTNQTMGRIPVFSLAERDRRWTRTRRLMERAGMDVLLGLPNSSHWDQFQADTRYLTQIGGNSTEAAVVFPCDGDVTAVLRNESDIAWWSRQQDWVVDLRPSRRAFAGPVIERLRELRLDSSCVGVAGLGGLPRAPEGTVIAGIMDRLRSELPGASLVNATELLQEARAVKSAEEVDFVRKADRLAEGALEKMAQIAQPGVAEREVYAGMIASMIAGGGEIPSMLLWGAGQQPPWPHRMLTDRVLQPGDVINNEVEAKWGGYIAQVVGPCVLGKADATTRAVFDRSVEVFWDLCSYMKPGVTFREIRERYRNGVEGAGYTCGAALLHGRGLGEDRPLLAGAGASAGDDLPLEEGMVFILKPAVFPAGGRDVIERAGEIVELAVRAGDTVVVTAGGTERLGQRPLVLLEL